jgi:hypothetical protein
MFLAVKLLKINAGNPIKNAKSPKGFSQEVEPIFSLKIHHPNPIKRKKGVI